MQQQYEPRTLDLALGPAKVSGTERFEQQSGIARAKESALGSFSSFNTRLQAWIVRDRGKGGVGGGHIGQRDYFENIAERAECGRESLLQLWQLNFFIEIVDIYCLAGLACSCEVGT